MGGFKCSVARPLGHDYTLDHFSWIGCVAAIHLDRTAILRGECVVELTCSFVPNWGHRLPYWAQRLRHVRGHLWAPMFGLILRMDATFIRSKWTQRHAPFSNAYKLSRGWPSNNFKWPSTSLDNSSRPQPVDLVHYPLNIFTTQSLADMFASTSSITFRAMTLFLIFLCSGQIGNGASCSKRCNCCYWLPIQLYVRLVLFQTRPWSL